VRRLPWSTLTVLYGSFAALMGYSATLWLLALGGVTLPFLALGALAVASGSCALQSSALWAAEAIATRPRRLPVSRGTHAA
jgi:hypothetical protein